MNIAHITYLLGENSLTINDLVHGDEITEVDAKVFERVMGLHFVPRHNLQTISKQILTLIQKLIYEYPLDLDSIKYVLFAHTADYIEPFGFHYIQNILFQLKITQAIYFESTLHKCASVFNLLSISEKLFCSLSSTDIILILVVDITFTPILQTIPGSTILGDAATAILLKKSDCLHQFLDAELASYGQFAKGIWADQNEQLLFQSTYIKNMTSLINKILSKNNIVIPKIRCVFPHNVNKISWKQLIHALSLFPEQVYLDNIATTA